MKKMRKRVIGIAVAIVVLIAIGVTLVLVNLNSLVKTGVERGGTMVLKVDTSLDTANVSMLGGSADLNGLTIGSPEGFKAEKMFSLDRAGTKVDINSLRSDVIRVKEVVIDGPDLTLEFKGTKTNWSVLLDSLKSDKPAEEKEEEKGPGKKIAIDYIVIKNGKIRIAGLPGMERLYVPMLKVEIRDIKSADGGGIDTKDAITKVINALFTSVLDSVRQGLSKENLAMLQGQFGEALSNANAVVQKSFQDAGKVVGETLGGAGKSVGEALGGAGKTVGEALKINVGDKKDETTEAESAADDTKKKGGSLLDGIFGGKKEEEKK